MATGWLLRCSRVEIPSDERSDDVALSVGDMAAGIADLGLGRVLFENRLQSCVVVPVVGLPSGWGDEGGDIVEGIQQRDQARQMLGVTTAFVQVKHAKNDAGHGWPAVAANGLFKKSMHAVVAVSRLPASSSFSVGTGCQAVSRRFPGLRGLRSLRRHSASGS